MIAKLVNSTAPLGTRENIDVSILHAEVKSGDLKNTHVTFTRKNVSNARKKFDDLTFLKKCGAINLTPCIAMEACETVCR